MSSVSTTNAQPSGPPPNVPQVTPTTPANADLGVNAPSNQTSQAVSLNYNATVANSSTTSAGSPPSVTPAPGPGRGQNVDTYA